MSRQGGKVSTTRADYVQHRPHEAARAVLRGEVGDVAELLVQRKEICCMQHTQRNTINNRSVPAVRAYYTVDKTRAISHVLPHLGQIRLSIPTSRSRSFQG